MPLGEVTLPGYVPSLGGVSLPVTLAADRSFVAADLGRLIKLAGNVLTLVDPSADGAFTLVGPGSTTGLLTRTLVAGESLGMTVIDGTFTAERPTSADVVDVASDTYAITPPMSRDVRSRSPSPLRRPR